MSQAAAAGQGGGPMARQTMGARGQVSGGGPPPPPIQGGQPQPPQTQPLQPSQQVNWQQGGLQPSQTQPIGGVTSGTQGAVPNTAPGGYTPPSAQHPEWFDTSISSDQWQAWEKEKMAGCPPNMPYKGRAGQCASKPDDCPEGMQVVGNDASGSAHCVPSNALPQQGGGGAGASTAAPPGYNQNQLIPGTNAPQLGYYGAMGNMGNLIQAIMALSQGGGQ